MGSIAQEYQLKGTIVNDQVSFKVKSDRLSGSRLLDPTVASDRPSAPLCHAADGVGIHKPARRRFTEWL